MPSALNRVRMKSDEVAALLKLPATTTLPSACVVTAVPYSAASLVTRPPAPKVVSRAPAARRSLPSRPSTCKRARRPPRRSGSGAGGEAGDQAAEPGGGGHRGIPLVRGGRAATLECRPSRPAGGCSGVSARTVRRTRQKNPENRARSIRRDLAMQPRAGVGPEVVGGADRHAQRLGPRRRSSRRRTAVGSERRNPHTFAPFERGTRLGDMPHALECKGP